MKSVVGERDFTLDGIRGWAALIVVVFHVLNEVFGVLFPVFRSPFLHPFLDGRLCVMIFFILSGQALSIGFFKSQNTRQVWELMVKRYARLAIPVLCSSFLVFLIMVLGLNYNVEAGVIVGRADWLSSWLGFTPSVPSLLQDALVRSFVTTKSHYNPFLWTMFWELQGSFYVFAALLLTVRLKNPLPVFIVLAGLLFFIFPKISCFFIGVSFALLQTLGFFDWMKSRKIVFFLSIVAVPVLFAYHYVTHEIIPGWDKQIVLLAAAVVGVIQCNDLFGRAFRTGLSQFLGRISFSLYLVHFAVMVSFMSWAIVLAHSDWSISWSEVALISASTIAVSILAAVSFFPIEKVTAQFNKKLVALVMPARVETLPPRPLTSP